MTERECSFFTGDLTRSYFIFHTIKHFRAYPSFISLVLSHSLKVHHQEFFVDYSVEVHLRGALRLLTIYLFIFFILMLFICF